MEIFHFHLIHSILRENEFKILYLHSIFEKAAYYGPSSSYYAPAYGPAAYTSSAYTSGQYYTPATSNVENTRLVIPQTNQGFRQRNQQYNSPDSRDGAAAQQQQQQQFDGNRGAQKPAQTIHIHIQSQPNSPYTQSSNGQQSQDQFNGQNQNNRPNQFNRKGAANRNVYADRMPYTNNGEQVKLRRYQVHRPGVQKEFYDVEERVIVRPAGSALIEFDTPTKKEDITDYQQPNGGRNFNSNQQRQQFNQRGYQPYNNNQQSSFNVDYQNDQSQHYFGQPQFVQSGPVYRVPDCGGNDGDDDQTSITPVNEYGPPEVPGGDSGGDSGGYDGGYGNRQTPQVPQYHPTTFAPPTNRYPTHNAGYPTTVIPLTPRPTYPTYPTYYPTTTVQGGTYPTTTVQGSYPRKVPQYPSTRK